MEIEYFSHDHPLVLKYLNHGEDTIGCYGCRRSIIGPFFSCFRCNFFLHTSCAELPTQMDHPLHPDHSLVLVVSPPSYLDGSCVCNACLKSPKGFTYHSLRCRFDLHTVCATLPSTIASQRHQHRCTLLLKSASFSCDDCHTKAEGISYLCYTCQFWVDPSCALLSRFTSTEPAARSEYHRHPLTAVSVSELNSDIREEMVCDICKTEIAKSEISVYYCKDCHFFAQIGCATLLTQALSDAIIDMKADDFIQQFKQQLRLERNRSLTNRSLTNLKDYWLRKQKPFFTCEHSLTHGDELKRDRMCGMCMQKISTRFVGCTECNFFLHELCAELPNHKKHPLEPHHPLTLNPADDFSCNNCNKSSSGFFYGFEDEGCNFKLDLRCGLIEHTLEHEGHEHTLYLVEERSSKECNACCNLCVGNTYVCVNFYLEAKCAVLPLTARHRYDKHRLTLVCHSDDDELGQFTCEPCDSKRDPKPWFYECVPCRFTAHLECINGKY